MRLFIALVIGFGTIFAVAMLYQQALSDQKDGVEYSALYSASKTELGTRVLQNVKGGRGFAIFMAHDLPRLVFYGLIFL